MRLRLFFITLCSFSALLSCKKDDKQSGEDITKPQQVTADANSEGIMRVDVELKDDTLKIRIQDRPKEGQLICELNGTAMEKCEDGMEIAKPTTGSHRLRVRVVENEKLISIGETRFQSGVVAEPSPTVEPNPEHAHPLAIEITNPNFLNGSALTSDKDFEFKFRLRNTPNCKPVYRCTFDKIGGAFAPLCNSDSGQKIKAERIARGLQYLSIVASCDQTAGPTLVAYWYGVPAEYQPLQVEFTKVGIDNHVFRLVKSNDCPDSLLKFQCSDSASKDFVACAASRRAPKPGFRFRATCNGQIGPTLTLR